MFEQYVVTDRTVAIHSKPNVDSSTVKSVPKGTVVRIYNTITGTTYSSCSLPDGTVGYITTKEAYVTAYTPPWLERIKEIVAYGEKYLGVPYEYGSARKTDTTFDCSDFQQWIYEHNTDIDLHSDSRTQCKYDGVGLDLSSIRSGDLVFFSKDGTDEGVYHVSMYVYPDRLLHTYSTTSDVLDANLAPLAKGTGGVTYSDFKVGSYWNRVAYKAKRIIQG